MNNNRFIIIVPFYNVEKWIKYNIRSIKKQKYTNFKCILIDDISTDDTVSIVESEIFNDDRFILIKNKEKKFALQNIVEAIDFADCSDEDIIVTLDGDDWLHSPSVFEYLNLFYQKKNCWITYGSYVEYPNKNVGKFAKQIPNEVIFNNTFRESPWTASHLRTFKFHLWNQIKRQDLLDSEGKFYRMTWDLAFMFPMLEMAGERSCYIDELLYVYNVSNPLNDHKVDNSYQVRLEKEIRSKPKYERISTKSNALKLMTWNRFDIAAKTFLAEMYKRNIENEFAEEMYLQHLKVWNDFHEKDPPKNTPQDFLSSFKTTFNSIEDHGFRKEDGMIPTLSQLAINGAHRIACCVVLDKNLQTKQARAGDGQLDCSFEYFKEKRNFVSTGLAEVYCDEMALEFCRRKDNLYTISLFPSHKVNIKDLTEIIKKNSKIIYKKEVELNKNGSFNYVKNLYDGEGWAGAKQQGFPGVREKRDLCFRFNEKLCVVLIEEDDFSKLTKLKDTIRKVCNVGKHSVHINDTQEETWRIASSVFNENSIHFLNNANTLKSLPNFEKLFKIYKESILKRIDFHEFCVDASSVLSSYGLRDCRDLDFLYSKKYVNITPDINCHNEEEKHYSKSRHEIIFNPRNHFYYSGVKFASLDTMIEMKENRDEIKDRKDVELMRNIK